MRSSLKSYVFRGNKENNLCKLYILLSKTNISRLDICRFAWSRQATLQSEK
uniref:Uncharacterized protein n=1 Tax=Anguilla anguilla TaxID=7936 RepID=A0A0E9Q9C3_ANGAN